MGIAHGTTIEGLPLTINVTDLNEFFHASDDDVMCVQLNYGQDFVKKSDIILTSIIVAPEE